MDTFRFSADEFVQRDAVQAFCLYLDFHEMGLGVTTLCEFTTERDVQHF